MSKDSPRTSVLRDNDLIQKGQDDLIRRGDARELLQQCDLMGNHPSDPLAVMINEIPAAQPTVSPDVVALVEALEFYADWDNWIQDWRGVSLVDQDEGKTARAALALIEKGNSK